MTIQNVVTYDVVILVKNPDLKLRPGMTANASILVAHKDDILKIPNAALRFRPDFAKKEAVTQKGAQAAPSAPPAPAPSLLNMDRLKAQLNISPDQQAAISHILKDMQSELEVARKARAGGLLQPKPRILSRSPAQRFVPCSMKSSAKNLIKWRNRPELRPFSPNSRSGFPCPRKGRCR